MAEMLNPTAITVNPSEFTKAVNQINAQYEKVKAQSNAQIEKCKQSMPLLYDKQWYESAAEETESILNDVGQTLVGMGWGVLNIAKDILLTPKYLADTLCDFINNDPIGKINGFPAYVLNGGLEQSISGQFQKFGSDFEKADTEKRSEMVMGVVGNLALLFIPGTVFTKFGKVGDAAKLSGNIAKAEKETEALKDIPKIDKGTKTLEDAQKAAKAAEAEKAAKAARAAEGNFLLTKSKEAINLAKASQGNSVYTGVDKWLPVQLNKGEIYYRGEPKGTEFFTTKESINSVGTSRKKLFEGLQVREDPVHGYRKEMQGYKLNTDLNAAQAKCLANSQFGKGGLEQKYIPNANELIEQGILIPVDKIILK